jgi:hypothetical protein
MSVEVEVDADVIDVQVRGLDRVWGFRSRVEIPISRVAHASVTVARDARVDLRIRTGGLFVPGVAAVGYFRGRTARRQWWCVRRAREVLVIDLTPASSFDRVVVQVANPHELCAAINNARHGRPPT